MSPERALTAYFAVFSQLSSPASIVVGQPQVADSVSATAARHVKLADLILLTRDLVAEEWEVVSLRFMAASGSVSYLRYVRSLADLPPDEFATGQRHPDDPELHEVQGTMARAPNYREIGKRLGRSSHHVSCMLTRARRKVRERIRALQAA